MAKAKKDLAHISADLRKLAVPVDSLNMDPKNTRKHSDRNLSSIQLSLERFGQRTPLVVQKTGAIVRKGNGTLESAIALGWKWIAAIVVDEADLDATAYSIADNRTSELAEWDNLELIRGFEELEMAEVFFSDKELNEIRLTLEDMEGYQKPEGAKGEGEDGATSGKPKGDGNWFYVEMYEQDETFLALQTMLAPVMRTKHEINADAFEAMVRLAGEHGILKEEEDSGDNNV